MDLSKIGAYVSARINKFKNDVAQRATQTIAPTWNNFVNNTISTTNPNSLNSQMGKVASSFDLGPTIKSAWKALPSRQFGEAIGTTLNRPLDYVNMKSMNNVDLTNANKYTDLAVKLQQQGRTKEAQDLFEKSRQLSQGVTQRSQQFGITNRQLQKDIIGSGIKTELALAGAGYTAENPLMPVLGGVISGGMNKLQGGSFREGLGTGVSESLPYSGIMQFTQPGVQYLAPTISKYIANPFFKNIAERGIVGVGNVLENRIINTATGNKNSVENDVFAFTLGALFHNPNAKTPTGEPIRINGWNDLPQSTKTTLIRVGKAAGMDTKPVSWSAEPSWDGVPKFIDDFRIKLENVKRQKALSAQQPYSIAESSMKIPEEKLKITTLKAKNYTPLEPEMGKQTLPWETPEFKQGFETGGKPAEKVPQGVPTRQEVQQTIDDKLNLFQENTAGYKTEAPVGGTKGASRYTNIMRGIEGKFSSEVEKAATSQNPIIRKAASAVQGLFKELGMSPEHMDEAMRLKGGIASSNERVYDAMDSLYQAIGNDPQSKARIDAVLDPQASKLKVSFSDLTEPERAVYSLIRQGYDLIHDISYANGSISPELYQKNLGKYSARLYAPFEIPEEINKFINSSPKKMQTDIYRSKGDVTQWKIDNKLDDPIYAMGKRLSQVETNRAVQRYSDFVASQPHLVSDTPKVGFTKLSDSPAYGQLKGKYIANSAAQELKGYFFSNQGLQSLYDAFRAYDRLPPRQLQKKLLTVFNPTTNIGNITTDNVFGFLVGVDPLTLNKNLIELKSNPASYKQISNYLMERGITGTDITRSDFVSKIGSIDELAAQKKPNVLKAATNKVTEFYGGTDDAYKAAALKSLLDQGKTLEEATTLVKDGFQNYQNVGKFYDLWSKTPVIGQPFIKFQGDLIRIIKNAAINKPLSLIGFLGTLKAISILSSRASGETDEQRVARENRFGANKIPGLDISLQWQTPIGEINIARYISPFYTTNLAESTTTQAVSKMFPFMMESVKDKTGKLDIAGTVAANANDPFLSAPIQLMADRDFRNKPISDPKASPYFGSDLSPEEQNANKLKWAARQYMPPTVNSLIDVGAAAQGKENMYGQTQTVPQALARVAGVKIQQATPEVIQKQQEKSKYFEAQTPAFNNLKANEKAAVLSIPKQEPDNTEDKIYKYTTMLQYPAVYNYMRDIAVGKVNGDISKVDPLYSYPYADVKKYMLYQKLGGSDYGSAEAKALYNANPVIGEISKARSDYFTKNPIEGMAQTSRPLPSTYVQQQMEAKNWRDPDVKAYLDALTQWKNDNREKAGLPPLEAYSGGSKFKPYAKKISARKISAGKIPSPKKLTVKKIKTAKLSTKSTAPKVKTLSRAKSQTKFKLARIKKPTFKLKSLI